MKKLLLSLAVVLAGCGGGGGGGTSSTQLMSPTQPVSPVFNINLKPTDLTLSCSTKANMQSTALYYENINPIDYNIQSEYGTDNNFWGIQIPVNYSNYLNINWSQCIGSNFSDKNTLVARWTWDMGPNLSEEGGIKSYPEIIYGKKPVGISKNNSSFPLVISSVKKLQVNWSIEIDKNNSSGDLLLESWISSNARPNGLTDGTMVAELAILLDCWNQSWCNKLPGEKVNIGGYEYIFSVNKGPVGGNPDMIIFNSVTPQLGKGGVDLGLFLTFLKSRGLLTDQQYINDVEYGTEILFGKGEVRLNSYSVTVN